ncbi:MAG TPA: MmgE/PrpD family protein [Pirellulaceae bacterium]|nr:MmgE/PrpD family protein [Pirellulaceae bacterium]
MTTLTLPANSNQARGLAQYALDFVHGNYEPDAAALALVEKFHLDSVGCAWAALAIGANAPRVLRDEALSYPVGDARPGAYCFGSTLRVPPEKAVVANSAAVRELDANGTNFGYNPTAGAIAGEFGHNDFYPVAVAGAQVAGSNGRKLLLAMLCLDEIRGRLAEVFSLKSYKIDHVVHGAIASAAVYGALMGLTVEQIESAIGMVVAHYVPFRAIRHGEQLSDSKGASAAMSAELAVLSVQRAMRGFVGPADIFRNPQAIFCLFQKPKQSHNSPFDLTLTTSGSEFAVQGMHFKLGLYEHQSAGAIQGLIDLLAGCPALLRDPAELRSIRITIYEPAYSIIGDPAKRDPRTRQSADHSLVYIIATLLRKAIEKQTASWLDLMLLPDDYDLPALHQTLTRQLMRRIEFVPGGPSYDALYPDGIPTTVEIEHARLGRLSSGLIKYPAGHARCVNFDWQPILDEKFVRFTRIAGLDAAALRSRLSNLVEKTPAEVRDLYL